MPNVINAIHTTNLVDGIHDTSSIEKGDINHIDSHHHTSSILNDAFSFIEGLNLEKQKISVAIENASKSDDIVERTRKFMKVQDKVAKYTVEIQMTSSILKKMAGNINELTKPQ
jgi:hypothetical protein